MARGLASGLDSYTVVENTEVMRSHLANTVYISGNLEKGPGGTQSRRRG
jgi:hypothetical protein